MKQSTLRAVRRRLGVSALAVATVAGLAMSADASASAASLPNGYKKTVGIDGQVVQVWRTGESASPAMSMAANGAGRSAVVSGTFSTQVSKGSGNLSVGYLVGCQVDITGFSGGLSGSIAPAGPTVSGSLTVPLNPGQVKYVPLFDKDFYLGASVQWDRQEIDVQQCGGYASARSVAVVFAAEDLDTANGTASGKSGLVQSYLYGKPFSLN
ncbi:hypothetical protein GTV32_17615 [Gordonia sp. SID5947]|uniref:MspA family porin n=1 Tax=Gordonia sp. SID5947 TaxID=2690315 RepID=UPI001368B008|nr:MspA family porin [Gordonia sp. SID5947]MYR08005.1 hypothetical protein [Gordonia sp. SID5947]